MLLVSACLLGVNCRYDGDNNRNEKVIDLFEDKGKKMVPACPEQLGGLPTPRNPSILTDEGYMVLEGDGKVIMRGEGNVTSKFLRGAEETLKLAEIFEVDKAILKSGSPSCGIKKISKSFQEKDEGTGVTSALLRRNGINLMSEKDL